MAWVAELKNTLSGLFFLGSVFFFLRWLRTREPEAKAPRGRGPGGWSGDGWCLLCAALAMASKSSTVVLPAILGLCAWWMDGRVRRRHVVSLLPLVLMAGAAGALTLWTQRMSLAHMGWSLSDNERWTRPWPGRWVTAGEAVWFYLGKLLWPHPLVAVYPRWQVHAGRWWEWLPLFFVSATLLFLGWRGWPWKRACFFAFGYFLAALLPVLGFFDGTDFRYSLVFDHFQYLASMGPLALAGAGMARLAHLAPREGARWQSLLGAGVLLALGALSWQRSEVYRDEETFWTDTVAKNPGGWLGRGNLGSALLLEGRVDDARAQYEQALAANPDYGVARNNLGVLLLRQGKVEEALAQVERAVAIDPNDFEARSNLGNALLAKGQVDQAIAQYEKALTLNPDYKFVYFNLGNARFAKGQVDEAMVQYEKAVAIDPGYAEAHNNLGIAFLRTARFDEATVQFQEALRLAPDYPNVQNNLATARMLARRTRPTQ